MKLEYLPDQSDPAIGAVPLAPQSASRVLQHMVDGCAGKQVVFDLDSTLLNNRPRNAQIMREFARHQGESKLSQARPEHFEDWSAENAMARIGLERSGIDRLLDSYLAFWQERFFSSEYCQYDDAIPGAADLVNAVAAGGGHVVYLTGRHEAMRQGSVLSLVNLGFPDPTGDRLGSGVKLIMKESFDEPDDRFKKSAIEKLQHHQAVHAAFDNEPAHINSYKAAFPDAMCVHLLTDHSMRSIRILDGIVSILDFVVTAEPISPV